MSPSGPDPGGYNLMLGACAAEINLLRKRRIGPYSPDFSANRTTMHLKIVKIWPRFSTFSLRSFLPRRLLAAPVATRHIIPLAFHRRPGIGGCKPPLPFSFLISSLSPPVPAPWRRGSGPYRRLPWTGRSVPGVDGAWGPDRSAPAPSGPWIRPRPAVAGRRERVR